MPLRLAIILVLLFDRSGSMARRLVLTFAIAVALSALELDRRPLPARPAPVVLLLNMPPGPRTRMRPYRAHHRYSSPGRTLVGNPSMGS